MKFLRKVFSFVFLALGILLGIYFSFLIISRLLLSQNIVISFGPGGAVDSKEDEETYSHYASRSSSSVKPRRSSRINPDTIDDVNELRKLAMESLNGKDFSYAGEIFRRIGKLDPDFSDLHWYIGLCEEGDENVAEAKRAFSKYRDKGGPDPQKLLYIADFLIKEKDLKNALEFTKASQGLKDTPESHYLVAKCLYLKGDCKNAIEELSLILEKEREYPDVLILLAECYEKTGNARNAVKSYQEAFDLEPRPYLLYRMGVIKSRSGDYKGAKSYLSRYTDIETDPGKIEDAKELLNATRISAMKKVPKEVERQTDFIPNVNLVGILKSDGGGEAYLTINGASETVKEGDTILNDYYVLSIRDECMVLLHDEDYLVLRPM